MRFPSLIYVTDPGREETPAEVFDDLKITELLSPEVTAVMGRGASRGDITERQRLFSALVPQAVGGSIGIGAEESDALYRSFEEVNRRAARLCAYAERRSEVRSELERDAVHLCLMSAYVDFVIAGAEMAGIPAFGDEESYPSAPMLAVRFRDAMKVESEKSAFIALKKDISSTVPSLLAILNFSLSVIGEGNEGRRRVTLSIPDESAAAAKSGKGAAKNAAEVDTMSDERYLDELLGCAEPLGLAMPEKTPPMPIKLPPFIAGLLASERAGEAAALAAFRRRHENELPEEALVFREESGFCLGITALCRRIASEGIPLCFAVLSETPGISVREAYDVTLLAKGEKRIVPNDINLSQNTPFFFLTGANGGGKTTYLRTVGISTVLCCSGCPIPAESAEICPPQRVLTHFPHDERFGLGGRFADEEARIADMRRVMTSSASTPGRDLILLNETYSTTGEQKAVARTEQLAAELKSAGALGIYVTHQHDAQSSGIPMLGVVVDDTDSNRRTYKVAPADNKGSSYARDILAKYRLDRDGLKERAGKLP